METMFSPPKFLPKATQRAWTGPRGGKLRVVVIDAAYDNLDDPLMQRLLGKILAMKVAGYRAQYRYGVLPIDTGDYIGVHLLLCEETPEGLDPIMGLKSVSAHRCDWHLAAFPALQLAHPERLPQHHQAVQRKIAEIRAKGERYAYSCSWTMHPLVREDRELSILCKNVNMMFFLRYYTEYDIPHIFAGATLRFKVEAWKEYLGFEAMSLDGKVLPDFNCSGFYGEPVRLMYLQKFTDECRFFLKQYDALWAERLTIGDTPAVERSLLVEQSVKRA
jgi:hypothetical protein